MRCKVLLIGVLLLLVGFVLAAPNAPTDLTLNSNATVSYDEGSFSVNWTSGGGDAATNYSIYVFSNNSLYLTATNDSVTGYAFSNTTEANYTFIIGAVNVTGYEVNSTGNISIYVDSTGPSFVNISNWSDYNNESVSVFINASDMSAVDTYSVNDTTNFEINASQYLVNLTVMTENVYVLNISVNDSVGNVVYQTIIVNITNVTIETATTTTTTTTSSSGGRISSETIVLGSQPQKITRTKRYIFTVGDDLHSLILRSIDRVNNMVKVVISSHYLVLELNVGEAKEVDLDSDGALDVVLMVESIYDDSIAIDIVISEFSVSVDLDDSVDQDEGDILTSDGDVPDDERSSLWVWWVVGIIIVVVAVVFYRKKLGDGHIKSKDIGKNVKLGN